MKTNGNGKYKKASSTEAQERNRKIYVLKHFGGLHNDVIGTVLGLTGERVRQVLKKHRETSLWLADFSNASVEHMFTRIGP